MQLLKIDEGKGKYWKIGDKYEDIEDINKEDLMELVNRVLDEEEIHIEAYDEEKIKNPSHKIIYESISFKLNDLRGKKDSFVDKRARMYLDDYERYTNKGNKEADSL